MNKFRNHQQLFIIILSMFILSSCAYMTIRKDKQELIGCKDNFIILRSNVTMSRLLDDTIEHKYVPKLTSIDVELNIVLEQAKAMKVPIFKISDPEYPLWKSRMEDVCNKISDLTDTFTKENNNVNVP